MKVEDGKGRGFEQGVNDENRGLTSSKSADRVFFVSRDRGEAFSLVSIVAAATAGDYISYLRNNSTTKYVYITEVHSGAVNSALLKLWRVSGTPTGTEIEPENLNGTSGRTAPVTAYGDGAIAGLSPLGRAIMPPRVTGGGHEQHNYRGALILGPNQAIAIEYDTGTTGGAEVTVLFHTEDIDKED